ncbi:hypothetical protein DPMN_087964 [Dreissena polymorpha]|uniref:Peptidase S1 domain-containing protein n=1 Tax=Dreissena polymorpha TaxID=45954 RepID=A0A9D4QWP0_DREPO|nr:hypothetical protein DPMN_087964 [Dreissena polymorpha]
MEDPEEGAEPAHNSHIIVKDVSDFTLLLGASRRIVNGQAFERGQWPFLVSLHYLKPNDYTIHTGIQHLCGGSLIDPYWVFTAAHCYSDDLSEGFSEVTQWRAVLGEYNQLIKDDGGQTVEI